MKRITTLALFAVTFVTSIYGAAGNISGSYKGELKISPSASLTLVFHFKNMDSGQTSFSFDSPKQNAYNIPGAVNFISADSVNVSVESIGMNFAGSKKDGVITGTFRQGIVSIPLTLTAEDNEPKRPQTPRPPFPYTTKDVKIESADGAVLAATITIPENCKDTTPAVVMVSGSGLQNRDEEVFGHKPFAVIADYLARNGVASIRYDDRGFAASTGSAADATTADFADDAQAVVNYMRNAEHFMHVGLLGHSEGSSVAFMLGARGIPDFIVAIGAPAVRGDSILISQNRELLAKNTVGKDVTDAYCKALGEVYDAKITEGNAAAAARAATISESWKGKPVLMSLGRNLGIIAEMSDPWMDYFIRYSPAADIAASECPALVIYGEKDTQVIPSLNKPVMTRLAPKADVREYPSLNHIMQHATTGAIDEYAEIEETFSPEVLTDMVSFILGLR